MAALRCKSTKISAEFSNKYQNPHRDTLLIKIHSKTGVVIPMPEKMAQKQSPYKGNGGKSAVKCRTGKGHFCDPAKSALL